MDEAKRNCALRICSIFVGDPEEALATDSIQVSPEGMGATDRGSAVFIRGEFSDRIGALANQGSVISEESFVFREDDKAYVDIQRIIPKAEQMESWPSIFPFHSQWIADMLAWIEPQDSAHVSFIEKDGFPIFFSARPASGKSSPATPVYCYDTAVGAEKHPPRVHFQARYWRRAAVAMRVWAEFCEETGREKPEFCLFWSPDFGLVFFSADESVCIMVAPLREE